MEFILFCFLDLLVCDVGLVQQVKLLTHPQELCFAELVITGDLTHILDEILDVQLVETQTMFGSFTD